MASLERETSYKIVNQPDDQTIRVNVHPGLCVVHLTQNDGDYHNDKDSTVKVSFAQLQELIIALEELRTKYVPREWSRD